MSDCAQSVACGCDKTIFPEGNPLILTGLSGLVWAMPITNTGPPFVWPTSNGGCDNPPDVSAGLAGAPNQVYNVGILIRGVVELAIYSGGVVIGGTGSRLIHGGSYFNDGHNLYSLIVSDPAAVYYLNGWNGVESYAPCYAVRYNATIQIKTGATVTLHADQVNGSEITNYPPQNITPLTGEPPITVNQVPYYDDYGQWLQLDVTGITAA